MSQFFDGLGEPYDEDLFAALEPEDELRRRRETRAGRQGQQSQRSRPGQQGRPLSQRPRAAGANRQPGARQGQRGRPSPQGPRAARGAQQGRHPRGCSCARCRAGGRHVAGCNCARCKGARTIVGQYLVGPSPTGAAGPREGSEQVRWIQSTLNRVMKLRLPVDGRMSPALRSALRDFQRREGLHPDGIFGPPTRAALARAAGTAPAGSEPPPDAAEPPPDAAEPPPGAAEPELFGELPGRRGNRAPGRGRARIADQDTQAPRAKRAPGRDPEAAGQQGPKRTRWLQRALNRALGLRLPEDGRPSPALRSAVRSFQRRRGLPEDGELSDELVGELVGLGGAPGRDGEDEAFIGSLMGALGSVGSYFTGGGSSAPSGSSYVPPPPAGGSSYVPAPPAGDTAGATLRGKMATIARQQWERWGRGTIQESDPNIRGVLQDYWQTSIGWLPSGSAWWETAWSAVFISWVVKKAGAGSSFNYSANHATYTAWAKQNKLDGNSNPFKAYRINEAKPRVGDIVCKDRGSGATYDNIRPGMFTHCDIVVEVMPGKMITMGGNLSNSVSTTPVTTDAQGFLRASDGYFAVIRVGG